MTTTYTIPNRPSGGDARSVSPILANFDAVLAALNSFDGGNIQASSLPSGGLADAARLGLTDGGTTRRGKSIIATEESRVNAAFGYLPTPDRVQSVVLPTDGLIVVSYSAVWKHNQGGVAPDAAIFLGANQLKCREHGGNLGNQAATANYTAPGTAGIYNPLVSCPIGLMTVSDDSGAAPDDTTTGQTVALAAILKASWTVGAATHYGVSWNGGGPCYIHAAAGTYDVGVQFRNQSAGDKTITVKNRKLWVWTIGF